MRAVREEGVIEERHYDHREDERIESSTHAFASHSMGLTGIIDCCL